MTKKSMVDERMVGLYTFLYTVQHSKELSKKRCAELEDLLDTLLVQIIEG